MGELNQTIFNMLLYKPLLGYWSLLFISSKIKNVTMFVKYFLFYLFPFGYRFNELLFTTFWTTSTTPNFFWLRKKLSVDFTNKYGFGTLSYINKLGKVVSIPVNFFNPLYNFFLCQFNSHVLKLSFQFTKS